MSLSPSKLKNVNYKQWFINHFEKLILAIVLLLVARAFMNAYWLPYNRTPLEMKQIATETRETIQSNEWPKPQKQKYPLEQDIQQQVNQMQQRMDIAALGYDYSTEMFWPLKARKEKVREPNWLPVSSLIASADRVFVAEINEAALAASAAANPATPAVEVADNSGLPSALKVRGGRPGEKGTQAVQNQFGGTLNIGLSFGGYGREAAEEAENQSRRIDRRREEAGGPGAASPGTSIDRSRYVGKGRRFVSVRGIIPLRKQLEELRTASSLQSRAAARSLLEFNQSEIERQSKVAGSDKWSEWEPIDLNESGLVLQKSGGYDIDIVDSSVTNNVVTMPLPQLASGLWDDYVSHPGVAKMELSEEEIEKQMKLDELILEQLRQQYEKQEKELARNARPAKRGWFDLKTDTSEARQKALDQMTEDEIFQKLAKEVETDPEKARALKEELVARRIVPQDNVMLFRYIDFDVDPGSSYRYRVRVIYTNPNLDRSLGEVVSADVVEGDYRETPWSDPTSEIVVPDDANYFLTDVKSRFGRTEAMIDVYEWKPEFGTTIAAKVGVAVGQFIGGKEKTKVAKLNERTFVEEEVVLNTGDVLVDLTAPPGISVSAHPDLQLTNIAKKSLQFENRALVVNRHGNLEILDPVTQQTQYAQVKQFQELQNTEMERLNSGGGGAIGGSGDDLMKGRRGGDDEEEDGKKEKSGRRS